MQKRTDRAGRAGAMALKAEGSRRMLTRAGGRATEGEVGGHPASAELTSAQTTGEVVERSRAPTTSLRRRGAAAAAGERSDPDLDWASGSAAAKPRNGGVKFGGKEVGGGGSWEGLGVDRLPLGRPPAARANARSPRRGASRERRWATVIFSIFPLLCFEIAVQYLNKYVYSSN